MREKVVAKVVTKWMFKYHFSLQFDQGFFVYLYTKIQRCIVQCHPYKTI
jgi:hypothetical protein